MTMSHASAPEDGRYNLPVEAIAGRPQPVAQLTPEQRLLEMVAYRRDPDVLEALCHFVEEVSGEWRCCISLNDWHGWSIRTWASPSLPAGFNAAISELSVHADTGPSTRPARLEAPANIADLASDPAWQGSPFRSLAVAHGLRACWSTPIYSSAGELLGAIAILQDQPGHPTPLQQELVANVAHVASIAIERAQSDARLSKAESDLVQMEGILGLSASLARNLVEPLSGVVINAGTCCRLLDAAPANLEGARATLRRTLRDCHRASEMIARLRELLGRPAAGSARLAASGD
jgi:hypothetical protein